MTPDAQRIAIAEACGWHRAQVEDYSFADPSKKRYRESWISPEGHPEREGIIENVRTNEPVLRAALESLRDIPIVGDVRGAGYFQAIELVKDRETKESFDDAESETLLRGFLSGELFKRGLICRADDRGDPVIQLSPPLISGPEQFDEIIAILRPVLEEASDRMHCQSH